MTLVSRIIPYDLVDVYSGKVFIWSRCAKFFNINGNRNAIRYFVDDKKAHPLICKGNVYDGVEAIW